MFAVECMISKDIVGNSACAGLMVLSHQRGAPHVHFILWLANFDVTAHNIDNIISAEIPMMGAEETEQRGLHNLVMDKMIHGPCGI